jgi:hypothetical protein
MDGEIIGQLYNCTCHVKIVELNTIRLLRGRNRVISVVNGYGLDGSGIESRAGTRFSAPVQTVPGDHPSFYKMSTGSFSQQ